MAHIPKTAFLPPPHNSPAWRHSNAVVAVKALHITCYTYPMRALIWYKGGKTNQYSSAKIATTFTTTPTLHVPLRLSLYPPAEQFKLEERAQKRSWVRGGGPISSDSYDTVFYPPNREASRVSPFSTNTPYNIFSFPHHHILHKWTWTTTWLEEYQGNEGFLVVVVVVHTQPRRDGYIQNQPDQPIQFTTQNAKQPASRLLQFNAKVEKRALYSS